MAIPVVSIFSAVAPLVMGAVDLYRKRNEATSANVNTDPNALSREAVRKRLVELESSDVEQSRLISELSRHVESLARTSAAAQEERRLLVRWLWILGSTAVVSLGLAIWSLAR